jgi:glycine oxidase
MLAPQAEVAHGSKGPLFDLCLASREIYPDFVAELEEVTQIRIGYGQAGTLFVASSFEEASVLAGIMQQQEEAGLPCEELDHAQVHELEPKLAESVQVGLLLPMDHHVENRVLMKALVAAGISRGVCYRTGTPVLGLVSERERVIGVRIPGEMLAGDVVVNAAGSWAGDVDPRLRLEIPIRPTRGQIALLQMLHPPLHHLIHSAHGYMVPWPDGRVLVGSTLESAGFNKSVTAGGMQHLLNGALRLVPGLAEACLEDAWAGFRPESADDIPVLGWSRLEGLLVAAGHFRNGILLAPITASLVSDLILKKTPSIPLEPFSPARFVAK